MRETAQALFQQHQDTWVLDTSEQFARWTIASVFPTTSTQESGVRLRVERDYQSKGGMLVNNLTSKIAQALFPQNSSFFEIGQTVEMQSIANALGADLKSTASLFAGIENRASARVFLNAGYSALCQAIKLLIVTGNALLYRDPVTKRFHTYSVRDYSVRRDGSTNVMVMVLRERIAVGDLPPEFRAANMAQDMDECADAELYTRVERKVINGHVNYVVSQEVEGKVVGTPSTYPENLCPYIPLVWNLITGEHYGRGQVEDYAGDFARLSALSEASLDYEVQMMRLLNIVDGSSGIDIDEVTEAETGDYVSGKGNVAGNGITAHEGGDAQKVSAVIGDIQQIMQQLSIAFMYTGNTRDAERVTAEEIRANISEANQTLGGIYASISEVLHVRLAHILTVEEEPKLLPLLNAGGISLDVMVGIASLNRQATVEKLQYVSNALSVVLPVLTQASQRFNPDLVIDAICQGYGVDRESLSYTDEQLQALQDQRQQAAQESAAAVQQGGQNIDPQNVALNSQQLGLTQ